MAFANKSAADPKITILNPDLTFLRVLEPVPGSLDKKGGRRRHL
jgi:hypothetical protein